MSLAWDVVLHVAMASAAGGEVFCWGIVLWQLAGRSPVSDRATTDMICDIPMADSEQKPGRSAKRRFPQNYWTKCPEIDGQAQKLVYMVKSQLGFAILDYYPATFDGRRPIFFLIVGGGMQCVNRIAMVPVAFAVAQLDGRRLAGFGFEFWEVFNKKFIVAGE